MDFILQLYTLYFILTDCSARPCQTFYRGWRTRKRVYRRLPQLREIAQRACAAYKAMLSDPSLRINNRTVAALEVSCARLANAWTVSQSRRVKHKGAE